MKILDTKLTQLNPDLIVVEKDISFKYLRLLKEKQVAAISYVKSSKLRRMARLF